ncbi:MAG: hypothetical protein Q7U08_06605, partial [Flavobacteriaceae bacterium]|nr:hypothetical protein [Flavobacteriaceae bacterium]
MKNTLFILLMSFISIMNLEAQDYGKVIAKDSLKQYNGTKNFYAVKTFVDQSTAKKPTNVILMIGDGMGVSHIYAGMTAN